jgi:sn-glycerol 3-phosphate transport system permease protein
MPPRRLASLNDLFSWAVWLFPTLVVIAFLASEWSGLRRLAQFLWDAFQGIPAFMGDMLTHYQEAPRQDILLSLALGAGLGFGLTAWLYPKERLAPPAQRWRGAAYGAGLGSLGSQLLLYPTLHCTYAFEVGNSQFLLGLALTVLGALLLLIPLWTVLFGALPTNQSTAGYFRGWSLPYLLLAPNLLLFILFLYYPALQILILSLRSRIFPLPQERFVCLENYTRLWEDPIYQSSLFTTFFITLALVVITMAVALAIALLASQKIRGAGLYRTLLIWPFALSPVVVGAVFLAMFREGNAGIINFILEETLGIQPSWLRDEYLARFAIVAAAVWNGLGFNIIFYIAGLQNIPKDLLEAAAIDGANAPQRFFRITFPLLSPFTFFLVITNITYAIYGIYGVVDTLTQGGPPLGPGGVDGGATKVLIYLLYEQGFESGGSAGLAAAQALILFLMVAGLTILQFRYVENRVTYSG